MRIKILLIFFICLACNGHKDQSKERDTRLVGAWKSDSTDEATRRTVGKVIMTFTKDGNLIYEIHDGDRLQRLNMIYRTSGDTLIINQRSSPREEKTKFRLESNKTLFLEFEETRTIFKRDIQ